MKFIISESRPNKAIDAFFDLKLKDKRVVSFEYRGVEKTVWLVDEKVVAFYVGNRFYLDEDIMETFMSIFSMNQYTARHELERYLKEKHNLDVIYPRLDDVRGIQAMYNQYKLNKIIYSYLESKFKPKEFYNMKDSLGGYSYTTCWIANKKVIGYFGKEDDDFKIFFIDRNIFDDIRQKFSLSFGDTRDIIRWYLHENHGIKVNSVLDMDLENKQKKYDDLTNF